MRNIGVTLGGLAASLGCFVASFMLDGLPGAASLMIGFFVAVVVTGHALATVTRGRTLRRRSSSAHRYRARPSTDTCHQCRQPRDSRNGILVCVRCDTLPADGLI